MTNIPTNSTFSEFNPKNSFAAHPDNPLKESELNGLFKKPLRQQIYRGICQNYCHKSSGLYSRIYTMFSGSQGCINCDLFAGNAKLATDLNSRAQMIDRIVSAVILLTGDNMKRQEQVWSGFVITPKYYLKKGGYAQ